MKAQFGLLVADIELCPVIVQKTTTEKIHIFAVLVELPMIMRKMRIYYSG